MKRGIGAERAAMRQVHYEADVVRKGVAPSSAPFVFAQTDIDLAARSTGNPTRRGHEHYLPIDKFSLAVLRDPVQIVDSRFRTWAHGISPGLSTRCHYTDHSTSRALLTDVALRALGFQPPLDRVQEAQGDATIQDAVVEGDLQVHHAADGDGVVHDDRSFHDGFGREYRRLRVVDDRDGDHGAKSARVVHRERPSRDVVGRELSAPRLPDDLVYFAGEAQSIQLVGVADDGYDQGSLLQVHRDADVDLLAQHDPVPVPHGVEDRMLLEALDHRLDDERQVGESHAFAFDELLLDPLTQRDEPAHVRLDHAPGVGRLALALGHAVRYGPPDARELDDLISIVDLYPFGRRLGFRSGRGLHRRSRRGLAFFDVALDVLLGHPAAGAGAGDLRDVHVVLRSEPPHHRRGTLQTQRLCALYGSSSVAAAAARPGDRALLLAVLGGGLGLGVRRRKLLPIDGDERDLGPHVHRGPFGDQKLLYLAGERRGKLGVDLVGIHLCQGLVLLDLVSLGLEPARYRPLRHALPELGHRHRCRHESLLLVAGQLEHRRLYLLGAGHEEVHHRFGERRRRDVRRADPHHRSVQPLERLPRHDRRDLTRYRPREVRLGDDQKLPGLPGRIEDSLPVQRVERPGLDDLGLYAVLVRDPLRYLQRRIQGQSVGDDREVRPLPMDPGLAERDVVVVVGYVLFYEAVRSLVLEEEDGVGVADGALQQSLGVGGEGRGDDLQARGVAEVRLDALGVVEGAAGHDAVGSPDGYGYVPRAVRAVVEAGGFAGDLVERRRDEVGELDLGYGAHPVHGEAYRGAYDQAFGQRRIHHPGRTELLLEALRDPEHPAGPAHVLAHDHHGLVGAHLLGQPLVDGLQQVLLGHLPSPPRRRVRAPLRDRRRAPLRRSRSPRRPRL